MTPSPQPMSRSRERRGRPRVVARPPTPGVYPPRRAAVVHLALVALLELTVIIASVGLCAGLMWLIGWPPLPPLFP